MPRHIRRRRGEAETMGQNPVLQQTSLYWGYSNVPDVEAELAAGEGDARGDDENVIINVEEERQPLVPPVDQVRRSTRVRRRPAYLDDYVTSDNDEDNM